MIWTRICPRLNQAGVVPRVLALITSTGKQYKTGRIRETYLSNPYYIGIHNQYMDLVNT